MLEAELPPEVEEYRLIRMLGSGAMGRVYLAEDRLLDRLVAIKFIAAEAPTAVARKRFFTEARAAARITHSNVVTVYRVAELRRQPFLVAEYVRGQSLAELTRPIASTQIAKIANDLARGLAAAHRRGVLHRDIKPANAMLSEDGVTKLLDFGLAELVSDTGLVEKTRLAGTPIYMAPELWTGGDPSPRTDIFALGILLFEMYCGEHPFGRKDGNTAEQRGAPLHTRVDEPDRPLCAVIERCIADDPLARFVSADALVEALDQLQAVAPAHLPDGSPYRGLFAFDAEHRDVFYGRRAEAIAIRERLRTDRFLVIAGDSGTGKSSLCRAGVLPLFGDATTLTVILGRAPIAALSTVFASVLERSETEIATLLAEDPSELARQLRARNREVVLFVDQFEELVTQATATEAALAAEALQVLVRGDSIRLLATARSDFLTRLAALPGLGEDLASALSLLRPLAPERLFEVVVEPAAAMGYAFESEDMVEALIAEARVADGGLPLLQFALGELWELRDEQRKIITKAALEKIGGVVGALARHADGVIGSLPAPERAAARAIVLSLVTPEGTRGRLDHGELVAVASRYCERPEVVVDRLVKGRLLTAHEAEGGQSAYTLVHEALLTSWDTLRGWMTEDGDARATQQRIERAAAEWERLGRRNDQLLTPRQLRDAKKVGDAALSQHTRSFVVASRRSRMRRRVIAWAVALAIPLSAAGLVAAGQYHRVAERDRGVGEGRALAAFAAVERQLYEIERSAAYAAFGRVDPTAEDRWARVLLLEPQVDASYVAAQQRVEVVLQDNPEHATSRALIAKVLLDRAQLADSSDRQAQRDDLLRRRELFGGKDVDVPVPLRVTTTPPASLTMARYELVDDRWTLGAARPLGSTIAPGSWLLTATDARGSSIRTPVLVTREHAIDLTLNVPAPREGFTFVAGGSFLYGSTGVEEKRAYYISQPSHQVTLAPYWIATNETTNSDYIEFLRSLPVAQRQQRLPSGNRDGYVTRLTQDRDGVFRLTMGFTPRTHSLREGENISYEDRQNNVEQDWRLLPVSGVSFEDELAYTRWLSESGRVPSARPCDEREWEHAARGADKRPYPHGQRLLPADANIDATYNRKQFAFGPDQVGLHPASDSPYGVHDLAGNVWEWTASSDNSRTPVGRGGCFFQVDVVARSENRSPDIASRRDAFYGIRVCADFHP